MSSKYLRISRSLICDNTAVGGGGGVMIHATPSTISNTTIVSNRVSPSPDVDRGGGIVADAVTVLGGTITGNSAGSGGGIAVWSAGAALANTLVLANPKGGNVAGTVSSKVSSIVGIPAGLTLADILVPGGLKDNGGLTKTIALTDSATNPARHQGDFGGLRSASRERPRSARPSEDDSVRHRRVRAPAVRPATRRCHAVHAPDTTA